jgi:hypothetical protein
MKRFLCGFAVLMVAVGGWAATQANEIVARIAFVV